MPLDFFHKKHTVIVYQNKVKINGVDYGLFLIPEKLFDRLSTEQQEEIFAMQDDYAYSFSLSE